MNLFLWVSNQVVKKLEQNYAVRDKQDVLAMCALQYAAKLEQNDNNINSSKDNNNEKVSELINIMSEIIIFRFLRVRGALLNRS